MCGVVDIKQYMWCCRYQEVCVVLLALSSMCGVVDIKKYVWCCIYQDVCVVL